MSTQILLAKSGVLTDEVKYVAKYEKMDPNFIREKVADGKIVILKSNSRRHSVPVGIGERMRAKVCANIGTVNFKSTLDEQMDNLRVIEQAGGDVVLDMSYGNFLDETRKSAVETTVLPVGSVPIYQASKDCIDLKDDISLLTKDIMFSEIQKQCEDGVDFIVVHCAVTKNLVEELTKTERLIGLASKGGAIHACHIKGTGCENPLYEYFDELLEIAKKHDVTLLLASAFRAGCTADSLDRLQLLEMITLGELAQRAKDAGVQSMVEAVGFTSLDKVPMYMKMLKNHTNNAPIFSMGVCACDCAFGYEHISSAIGSSMAMCHGVDMIYAVAPNQNISTQDPPDIKEGIVAAKIAANCADLAKGNAIAKKLNNDVAMAKFKLNRKDQIDKALDKTIFEGVSHAKAARNAASSPLNYAIKLYKKYFK